jgi:EAL domain-containing protein (putative c-di-GMP-specific phosphodiesterase class I)
VALIESSGIDPRRIVIEVTETALMQDYEQVQASLTILRSMGLKVALDDFGSGQSSLSYVHQLSLDKIKIDRGFIRNIATQENARNIVKTVIDLCRNLKFDCVVEGVETAEQAEIVGRLGCSTMQGYFFAKPMPQSEIENYIARFRMSDNPRMAVAAG